MSVSKPIYRAITALILIILLAGCFPMPTPPVLPVIPTAFVIPTTTTPAPSFTPSVSPTITRTPVPSLTPSLTPTITATPIIVGPAKFPANVNPLTGLAVAKPQLFERRPVLIKVSNYPAEGRPQAGLSSADLVFEAYIGDGGNRFTALFYGQDSPQVGPVRSARLSDVQLTSLYQGLLAYKSADGYTRSVLWKQLTNRAISGAPITCPALCDNGSNTVTSIFANSGLLSQYAIDNDIDNKRPDLTGMYFDSRLQPIDQLGNQLAVNFNSLNRGEWRYDPHTGLYKRWIEKLDANNAITMEPLLDRNTQQQLAFANVLVLYSYYLEYAPTLYDIELWHNKKGRSAVLFRDGQAIDGIWKAVNDDSPLQFFTLRGDPLPLKPGNTWMVLTGITSRLKQPSPGEWELTFRIP